MNFIRNTEETTPTVVDHHEFKWNADLPDSPDHFYQADQGNLRPIFEGAQRFHRVTPRIEKTFSVKLCASSAKLCIPILFL